MITVNDQVELLYDIHTAVSPFYWLFQGDTGIIVGPDLGDGWYQVWFAHASICWSIHKNEIRKIVPATCKYRDHDFPRWSPHRE